MPRSLVQSDTSTTLRRGSELRGSELLAKDGGIGKVDDTLFDGVDWRLRYFVVNTGTWLNQRRVLISPACLGHPEGESPSIPVCLTRKQVEESPMADLAKPVSERYESDLQAYYGWQPPWSSPEKIPDAERTDDRPLRSMREVTGYGIAATDGTIGHVEDFVLEERTWKVRYMVVDTRNWLPGRKVLVAPTWISGMHWPEGEVTVDLTRDAIRSSPRFDSGKPIDRTYESLLYDYYGRPRYW